MSVFCAVVERIVDGQSQSLCFFKPTRRKWQSVLKVLAYKVQNVFSGHKFVSKIVDAERAEYLFVSYTEFILRHQIDNATLSNA